VCVTAGRRGTSSVRGEVCVVRYRFAVCLVLFALARAFFCGRKRAGDGMKCEGGEVCVRCVGVCVCGACV